MGTRSQLMSTSSTATATFDRSGRNLTVYLSGELDAASAPSISAAISTHVHGDDAQVWLDMSTLTFCDSSGIMLLFHVNERVTAAGARFAIFNPTPPVRRVIDMCDPSRLLNIRT